MKKLVLTSLGLQGLLNGVMVPFRGKTKNDEYFAILLPVSFTNWKDVEIYLSSENQTLQGEVILHQLEVLSVDVFRDGGTKYLTTNKGKFVIPSSLGLHSTDPITFRQDPVVVF